MVPTDLGILRLSPKLADYGADGGDICTIKSSLTYPHPDTEGWRADFEDWRGISNTRRVIYGPRSPYSRGPTGATWGLQTGALPTVWSTLQRMARVVAPQRGAPQSTIQPKSAQPSAWCSKGAHGRRLSRAGMWGVESDTHTPTGGEKSFAFRFKDLRPRPLVSDDYCSVRLSPQAALHAVRPSMPPAFQGAIW